MTQKKSCNKNYINIFMAFDNLKFSMQLSLPMKVLIIFFKNLQIIYCIIQCGVLFPPSNRERNFIFSDTICQKFQNPQL